MGGDVTRQLKLKKFRDISVADPFFDSLKSGYREFDDWFARKADEELYVVDDDGRLSGMIYLKSEDGGVVDMAPPLPASRWLKVGTLKIEGRGTKLGERVLKKIFDTAIAENRDGIYITVFDVHAELISLFLRYGFVVHGSKTTQNGVEQVLKRDLRTRTGDIVADYPFIHTKNQSAWLLAVYPEYHSQLLPDSILNNEAREILRDVSHTNTIHKAYIGRIPLTRMSRGDLVVIYRTTDNKAPAYYRSVATSICVVEDVKRKADFANLDAFLGYCAAHSVFSEDELRSQFDSTDRLYVAKMTYNVAFNKRTTRGQLLDEVGISEQPRWDLRYLTPNQLQTIARLGGVDARLIVD